MMKGLGVNLQHGQPGAFCLRATFSGTLFVLVLLLGSLVLFPFAQAEAEEADRLTIHGFGGWAFGITDNENRYVLGTEDGNYDYVNFALNLNARITEGFQFHVQPYYVEDMNSSDAGLDYAFVEWQFSENHAFRFGKVKTSFMLYNEIYDVGTLRPFFFLPQGIYREPSTKAYKGAGVTGQLYSGAQWEVQYDLFAGRGELQPQRSYNVSIAEAPGGKWYIESANAVTITVFGEDMFGGRLWTTTPISGLSFGLSYYSAEVGIRINDTFSGLTMKQDSEQDIGRYHFGGVSLEYNRHPFLVRMEYVGESQPAEHGRDYCDTGYAEVAWRMSELLQIASRYEYMESDQDEEGPFSYHRDLAFGVNLWCRQDLVVKMSYHFVEGNGFASPDAVEDIFSLLFQGQSDESTRMLLLGVQYSF